MIEKNMANPRMLKKRCAIATFFASIEADMLAMIAVIGEPILAPRRNPMAIGSPTRELPARMSTSPVKTALDWKIAVSTAPTMIAL